MEYPESICLKENIIFDTHAHLDDARFDEIMAQARKCCKKVDPDCDIIF